MGGSKRLPLYPLWARSRRRGDNPRSPPRRKLLAQARRLRSFAERSELLSTSLVWYTLQHAHAAARHAPPESATGLHCHARPWSGLATPLRPYQSLAEAADIKIKIPDLDPQILAS
jgi:hypothetical protein